MLKKRLINNNKSFLNSQIDKMIIQFYNTSAIWCLTIKISNFYYIVAIDIVV
jgi:hypothetical protein